MSEFLQDLGPWLLSGLGIGMMLGGWLVERAMKKCEAELLDMLVEQQELLKQQQVLLESKEKDEADWWKKDN